MPSAHETVTKWANIHHTLTTLVVLDFTTPSVDYEGKSDGGWIYLNGLTVTLDGKAWNAHITITKPSKKGATTDTWNLCHLTITRTSNPHVFYEVTDDGEVKTTDKLLDMTGKNRKASEHYEGNQINDAKVVNAVKSDIAQLFAHLA
ncbi:hypothetical protein [Actinokineospora globicatena]|uniref:Uncharacterized protein n=1 Tax=Actinokineospora globicatena TaxID=103729 RepID=A0A9W6V9B7_9PSEU|nr:hypothetical protein [Actinokineospora globicatena]MCP2306727.1 hypothetical protein [Actinokineospora globicatena]GLW82155.1 hypothetical protein Aglo01_66360 [Actinokineospora globicatena]GLW88948.1 hypothetical protein Aglo02_65870 [Actinokineospora globicatena]GLW94940.1 hypothetical protein Aglo03_57560 [Actinokineospora globicatena]